MATSTTTELTLQEHRTLMFEELGFSTQESILLAATRGCNGFPLYWGDVQRMLDAGCSYELALAIFT